MGRIGSIRSCSFLAPHTAFSIAGSSKTCSILLCACKSSDGATERRGTHLPSCTPVRFALGALKGAARLWLAVVVHGRAVERTPCRRQLCLARREQCGARA